MLMWIPAAPSRAFERKLKSIPWNLSEANQPTVYAPSAKKATYPRSSRPANPTTTFSPRASIA